MKKNALSYGWEEFLYWKQCHSVQKWLCISLILYHEILGLMHLALVFIFKFALGEVFWYASITCFLLHESIYLYCPTINYKYTIFFHFHIIILLLRRSYNCHSSHLCLKLSKKIFPYFLFARVSFLQSTDPLGTYDIFEVGPSVQNDLLSQLMDCSNCQFTCTSMHWQVY